MGGIPNTTAATSHAIAIKVNGLIIGMIQTWAPSQARTITPVYQMKPENTGEPVENVPGNLSGLTIQVTRYDLFKSRMEQAWGPNNDYKTMLSNQVDPFEVQEVWKRPSLSTSVVVYVGCWFSSIGRNMAVQGDRLVNASATLSYVKSYPMAV